MILRDHNDIPLHGLTDISIANNNLNDYCAKHIFGYVDDLDILDAPADIWGLGGE